MARRIAASFVVVVATTGCSRDAERIEPEHVVSKPSAVPSSPPPKPEPEPIHGNPPPNDILVFDGECRSVPFGMKVSASSMIVPCPEKAIQRSGGKCFVAANEHCPVLAKCNPPPPLTPVRCP